MNDDFNQKIKQRKIIHIDLDCFYAAVEIRDNPDLADKPVAVGFDGVRGVLCTCNYVARSYGVRSAMASKIAREKCHDLVILPVNMLKYKNVSKQIHTIFHEFTDLIEPIALDEAYLDVTDCDLYDNSATLIARAIRYQVFSATGLTASAGVAGNKFLAKVASGINKPDGLYAIPPYDVDNFIKKLPVSKIWGVGKVTLPKLEKLNIQTCLDLQQLSLKQLIDNFGKLGVRLYYFSRGIDNSEVRSDRERKSVSVEITFLEDISGIHNLIEKLRDLFPKLEERLLPIRQKYQIKGLYLKIKFSDYKIQTVAIANNAPNLGNYIRLLEKINLGKSIRLLGMGVTLYSQLESDYMQQNLFENLS